MHHLLAIRDDDACIYRIRVLIHEPVHGMDDLLPGEVLAVVLNDVIDYQPRLPG